MREYHSDSVLPASQASKQFKLQWKNTNPSDVRDQVQKGIIRSTRLYPLSDNFKVMYTVDAAGDYQVHAGLAESFGLDATYYNDMSLSSPKFVKGVDAIDWTCGYSDGSGSCEDFQFSWGGSSVAGEGFAGDSDPRASSVGLSDKHGFSIRWGGLIWPMPDVSSGAGQDCVCQPVL